MQRVFSPEYEAWRREPERSAVAAGFGLITCWVLGSYIALQSFGAVPGTALAADRTLLVAMVLPWVIGFTLCVPRRSRYFKGAAVPGWVAGWTFGCLPFVIGSVLELIG